MQSVWIHKLRVYKSVIAAYKPENNHIWRFICWRCSGGFDRLVWGLFSKTTCSQRSPVLNMTVSSFQQNIADCDSGKHGIRTKRKVSEGTVAHSLETGSVLSRIREHTIRRSICQTVFTDRKAASSQIQNLLNTEQKTQKAAVWWDLRGWAAPRRYFLPEKETFWIFPHLHRNITDFECGLSLFKPAVDYKL